MSEENIVTIKKRFISLAKELHFTLSSMAENGWNGFECTHESLETLNSWPNKNRSFSETLDDVLFDLKDCKRCLLAKTRKNIVFGAGDPNAKLLFIGEGPGFEEDKKGKPFVGAAGKLLTKIIESMNLTRESVYICNIIKCRPPSNRNPKPEEIGSCLPFLKRQIEAIKPTFICALGTFAAQTLIGTKRPISRLRGIFHDLDGIKVLPTYHPAYLLRNPNRKRDVWEDMKKLMKAMDRDR